MQLDVHGAEGSQVVSGNVRLGLGSGSERHCRDYENTKEHEERDCFLTMREKSRSES
jgi:hypothetical protein